MIEKLFIKDYLIIEESEINFTPGLNILTGETGAGKSIIIDALSLILGGRADYSLIRKGKEKLIVEGHFNFKGYPAALSYLQEKEVDDNKGYLIVRRELLSKGISRAYLNDSPVQVGDLKELGNIIIDIHSQNEHQSLLNKETHLTLLDTFTGGKLQMSEYLEDYNSLKKIIKEYQSFLSKKDSLAEKRGFLDFQLKEINNLNPQPGEDEEIETELKKLENSEQISTGVNVVLNLLSEEEGSILEKLSNVNKEIKKLSVYDDFFSSLASELESAAINIKEISGSLSGYGAGVNFDPVRIEQIRERLSSIIFLKKKYNLTLNDLIKKGEEIEKELSFAENFDYEIEKIKENINKKREEVYKKALQISKQRKKASKDLEKKVNEYLNEVGLESAEFKIEIKDSEAVRDAMLCVKEKNKEISLSGKGIDDIEFFIKTNKGSEFGSLKKSASGGEISRVMLSIKSALAGKDNIPILVFDEIDAGISGRIAEKVGKVLQELSLSHQIISITHLPQIAAKSSNHLYISKEEKKNDTVTQIKTLSKEEKIAEIAKMISGEKVTEAAMKSAKELIKL